MKFSAFNSTPRWRSVYSLTSVVEALEGFQDFELEVRAAAITLYASEIATDCGWQQETAEVHLYALTALLCELGGAQ
jgi:hypothetical protein